MVSHMILMQCDYVLLPSQLTHIFAAQLNSWRSYSTLSRQTVVPN
jgi:hypothetical protein